MRLLDIRDEEIDRKTLTTLARFFSDYARAVGAAVIEPIEVDFRNLQLTFKMTGCWEAVTYLQLYGKSRKPVCHFTRGNIAGVASRVCGIELKAVETRCQAMGHSHCIIKLTPPDKQK